MTSVRLATGRSVSATASKQAPSRNLTLMLRIFKMMAGAFMRAGNRAGIRFGLATFVAYLFVVGTLLHVAASYAVDTPFGTIICSFGMGDTGHGAPDAGHADKSDCALCAQHHAAALLPALPDRPPLPVLHALDAPLRPAGIATPAIALAAWPAKPRAPPIGMVTA